MRTRTWFVAALGLPALLLGVVACSSGGGGGGAGLFKIDSCTLGCRSNGNCSINQVALNEEIKLRFNAAVNPSSVTRSTFSVINRSTGLEPTSIFVVDGPEVRFRPQITFDSSGNPVFGLQQGETYILRIPGTDQSAGGTISSLDGRRNGREYRCEISATQGINDPRPGPPSVEVFLERDPDNAPGVLESLDSPPAGAPPVELGANVVLVFNELMNPSTLVNPVTQSSGFLNFRVDVDGDLGTTNDQRELPSRFSISLDQQALTTTVRIDPIPLMPGPGNDPQNPRLMFVSFSQGIKDLAGNDLTNPDPRSFVTVQNPGTRFELFENFQGNANEDPERTSARWNPGAQGYLEQGPGGGSGLHGDLTPTTAGIITIDTANYVAPATETLTGVDETITDGVFYFTKLDIPRDVTVRFVGSEIAQIYAASANVRGTLLVGGEDAPLHPGVNDPCRAGATWPPVPTGWGGTPGVGGPAGGDGGFGGDDPRPMGTPPGGMPRTMAPRSIDGQPGEGIGGTGATGNGGGGGSTAFPATTISTDPSARLANVTLALFLNYSLQRAGGGGGGSNATAGTAGQQGEMTGLGGPPGVAGTVPAGVLPAVPRTSVGGAGGGGGGVHSFFTNQIAGRLSACPPTYNPKPQINAADTVEIWNTGAGGGGGGGTAILQVGRDLFLTGTIDAGGGNGGDTRDALSGSTAEAVGGGGGSGGNVRVEVGNVFSPNGTNRLVVSGGRGGLSRIPSAGGQGGAGYAHIRTSPALPIAQAQPLVDPPSSASVAGYQVGDYDNSSRATSTWLSAEGAFFLFEWVDFTITYAVGPPGTNPNDPNFQQQITRADLSANGGSWPAFPNAPFTVFFQGAEADEEGNPKAGSIGEWVQDPADLLASKNLVRFAVVFNRAQSATSQVLAVNEVRIVIEPN